MNARLGVSASAIALLLALQAPAWAADCGDKTGPGGTNVVCNCGDTVTTTTKLVTNSLDPNFDPVISTGAGDVCAGNGLQIGASNVFLSLKGGTIRGNGVGRGIRFLNAPTNVTVENGTIIGFGGGVTHDDVNGVSNAKIQKLRLLQNAFGVNLIGGGPVADSVLIDYLSVEGTTQNTPDTCEGITIHGDGNVIMRSEVKNGGPGAGVCALGNNNLVSFVTSRGGTFGIAALSGEGNVIEHCDASGNSGPGFTLFSGSSYTLRNSIAQSNGGNGVSASGGGHHFDFNESKLNGGSGMAIFGSGHTFTYNSTSSNAGDGLIAPDAGNFDQGGNTGAANGGIQCRISGVNCK